MTPSDLSTLTMSSSSTSRPERVSQPNSRPASTTASRRTSMLPPGMPTSSYSTHRSSFIAGDDYTTVPLRHPRPLTAAELYLECEKEQEAVVNRLTRELTALRAQTASVASNASHSSTSSQSILPVDISDPNPTHQMTGATHPTPSRRARSSSSVSGRSAHVPASGAPALANISTGLANTAGQHHHSAANSPGLALSGVSQASMDRAMAANGAGDPTTTTTTTLSRQPSMSASGRSTPARGSLDNMRNTNNNNNNSGFLSNRPSFSSSATRDQALSSTTHIPLLHQQHDPSSHAYRTEMEIVKAENDALRQRVRALERALRDRRRRDSSLSSVDAAAAAARGDPPSGMGIGIGGVAGPRERSESQSTSASSHIAVSSSSAPHRRESSRRPAAAAAAVTGMTTTAAATPTANATANATSVVGLPDEDLKVGESAASSSLLGATAAAAGGGGR
ncbi:uncharacterized protein K489DRAFT_411357 [Dissoconium aciculare CBS 342.82]|uniref:Uncharacterized protein n=1 Tax=Dissoconium aciculare CBS 342.82 TaxID=1314786 RepID=A0A6J3M1Y6_9PEZI|nr:uncharacterized protein K489DRAFT_411357 [Dissoconium aciculare CBS 342.82]KAF1820937.1 hypothetical protein K489DRAFT_411357 [Dissoconium aciculare CBS 342.82]